MTDLPYMRKRKNRWFFSARDKDGKVHEYAGGNSEVECFKAYLRYMETNNVSGLYINTRRIPYQTFLKEWLRDEVEPNYSDNTYDQYSFVVLRHLIPDLGTTFLGKLTPTILNDWLLSKRDAGYARRTVLVFYHVIRSSLRWGISVRRYLTSPESPLGGLKMPVYRELPEDVNIFTPAEIRKIFTKFRPGTPLYVPCMLAYGTGMRAGEILGLTWDKIDLEKRLISVTTTLYDKKYTFKLEPQPKNMASVRTIAFSQKVYDALTFSPPSSDFVCLNREGKPMTSNNLRYFNLWCKENLGHGTFHTFRRTHATMLMDNGVQLDYVTKRMGHSTTATTTRNYIRITDRRNKAVMDTLDSIL